MLKLIMIRNGSLIEQNFSDSVSLMKQCKYLQSQGFVVVDIKGYPRTNVPNPGAH